MVSARCEQDIYITAVFRMNHVVSMAWRAVGDARAARYVTVTRSRAGKVSKLQCWESRSSMTVLIPIYNSASTTSIHLHFLLIKTCSEPLVTVS